MNYQEELPIVKSPFNYVDSRAFHGFSYYTEISHNSLILSIVIGILEIYARFKSQNLRKYLNFIDRAMEKFSLSAKAKYPLSIQQISFLSDFIENIKSCENSLQAFYYIDKHISDISHSLNYLDLGFRCLLASIFDAEEKSTYRKMVLLNDNLQSIRMLILYHVAEKIGVQLDIYDNVEKESYKSPLTSDFPIINLYTWNSIYYLVYTEEMYQERIDPNFNNELKTGPYFMSMKKKYFKPLNTNNPPPANLDFGNDVQVLTEIIKRTAEELNEYKFSDGYSKFIGECVKNNQVVNSINILKKFVKTIPDSSERTNERVAVGTASVSLDRMEVDRMEVDASTYLKCCSICRRELALNNFLNTSHLNCGVCKDCACRSYNCPKCFIQYNLEDRKLLRLA